MDKRYQVFVSSTYLDLAEERNEIMQALLELECMPAGMELFPAANDTQWEWIKRVIDESDYYIVVIGGRYGSVSEKTGLSYTEMEYRYALETNRPIIGFIHQDPESLSASKTERTEANKEKLNGFKNLVQSKLCKFYNSPEDLGSKVSRSIIQLKKQYPAIGWVRADALENFTSSNEYILLMKENEELKKKIEAIELESPLQSNSLASGTDTFGIEYLYNISEQQDDNPKSWRKIGEGTDICNMSWDAIFSSLALEFIKSDTYYFTNPLPNIIKDIEKDKLIQKHPTHRCQSIRVDSQSMSTILIQLRALKLITSSKGDTWKITKYGDEYLVKLKGVKK